MMLMMMMMILLLPCLPSRTSEVGRMTSVPRSQVVSGQQTGELPRCLC